MSCEVEISSIVKEIFLGQEKEVEVYFAEGGVGWNPVGSNANLTKALENNKIMSLSKSVELFAKKFYH